MVWYLCSEIVEKRNTHTHYSLKNKTKKQILTQTKMLPEMSTADASLILQSWLITLKLYGDN